MKKANVYNDLPYWIRRRVEILRYDESWVLESIPALHNKSVLESFNDGEFELIMRVFSRHGEYTGNLDIILSNFTEDERKELEKVDSRAGMRS